MSSVVLYIRFVIRMYVVIQLHMVTYSNQYNIHNYTCTSIIIIHAGQMVYMQPSSMVAAYNEQSPHSNIYSELALNLFLMCTCISFCWSKFTQMDKAIPWNQKYGLQRLHMA